MSTTVTSKGQVTIPKPVRDQLGLEAGSQVEFVMGENGEIVVRRADGERPESRFLRMRKYAKPPEMSTDELMKLLRGDD